MSLSKVIKTAELELGVTEWPKGSNRVKYNTAYYEKEVSGKTYPWCVTFLWWCFQQAGEGKAFFGGGKTASCGTLLRWYREQGQTVPASEVQPGDIVILNFSGTQETQHCGLVEDTPVQNGRQVIYTIEGNTSQHGSQSNGGEVCRKCRYPAQVVGVCRPQYTEEVEPVDDIKGHWAEQAIRRCIRRGLIKGYPDGTFAPDKPVTRAELCVMLDRLVQTFVGEDDGK